MGGGSDSKKQLGKILLQQKLVSADELQEILEDQKREPGVRLASTAARKGRVTMLDALHALAEQHGVPSIDLTETVIALAVLKLIPVEMAREHMVLPVRVEGDHLVLAMSSPQRSSVIEELEFVAGKKIQPHVTLDYVLRKVIEHAYDSLANGGEYYIGAHVTEAQLAALGLPNLPRAPEPLQDEPPEPARNRPLGDELDQAFTQRMMTSEPPQMSAPDASARVLCASSDPELRARLGRALREAGITAGDADTGLKALELIRDEPPRVLVLDCDARSPHGLDVCQRLRMNPRTSALPIVVLYDAAGGWRLARDLERKFRIRHVFEKPIDESRVLHTVRLLLDGKDVPSELPPLSPAAEAKWSAAMAGYERGEIDMAIGELEAGLALEPHAFELHYHLGLLYGRRDDLFGAVRELETAVRLQPSHFAAIKNLAVVYQRIGFVHKAVDAWERAMSTAPDDETRANIKEHMISLL